jgi:hypothetical protein
VREELAIPSSWQRASLITVGAGCADLRDFISSEERALIGLTRVDSPGLGAMQYELWFDPTAPAVESTRYIEKILSTLLKQQSLGKLVGLTIEALVNDTIPPKALPPSTTCRIA